MNAMSVSQHADNGMSFAVLFSSSVQSAISPQPSSHLASSLQTYPSFLKRYIPFQTKPFILCKDNVASNAKLIQRVTLHTFAAGELSGKA